MLIANGFAARAAAQLPIQDPTPAPTESITVAADTIRNWTQNDQRVLLLKGNVFVSQGLKSMRASAAVIWVYGDAAPKDTLKRIDVYAEGGVRSAGPRRRSDTADAFESFQTRAELRIEMKERLVGPAVDDPVYRRGEARRVGDALPSTIQLTSFQSDQTLSSPDGAPLRRIKLQSRTFKPFDFETVRVSDSEQASVFTGGINLIIYNVQGIGTVDILTDRLVMWRSAGDAKDMAQGETTQGPNEPLELYLDGNVVIRQGPRKFECKQMYYDVSRNLALATDAEMESVHDELGGPVYFRARKLRQVAADKFIAERTQVTPSPFPSPGYDLQAEESVLEGLPGMNRDPANGEPKPGSRNMVSSTNNFFYLEGIPVFYLPYVEKDLEDMGTPLRKLAFRQSRSYGTEVQTTWDMSSLLGWHQPPWVTKWELNLDFMSERGPGIGTLFEYRGSSLFGVEGQNHGVVDSWWLSDSGLDRLGEGRNDIEPEQDFRGRFLWRHHQELPDDFSLSLEFAWITDINFLEQFFEKEWEEDKDQETAIYLKQQRDNWAWSAFARARLLDWVPTTDYLPQLDFYWIGEPLLGDWLTYYMHSSLGYLDMLDSDRSSGDIYPPPVGKEGPTYVGSRMDSLHELDLPFSTGPIRVVPYLKGRTTAWSRTLGDDNTRLYGAAGARASMPLWRVFPEVESELWNVHGLAHKIVFGLDYMIAQADLEHDMLPQYDELEEDSEQVFRRRFLYRDYTVPGITFPPGLDPRMYAIRTGLMTAPESVDDLNVMRFDMRQRLQTKRGLPGERHVIDWMTLDTGFSWFLAKDRDNFGDPIGLINYDYSWHIGDRTSILSRGWFETYDDHPLMWNAGVFMERPPRGSLYVGYQILDPVGSRVAQFSYNYWMSPKYISSFSTSYDFGETTNLGQSLVLTRIGSDIVFRLGLSWNPLRDNFGIGIEVQPRLLPGMHLGSLGGSRIPVEYAPVE